MVWLLEKKVIHHVLDLGVEKLEIPVRVKFECEIREGAYVPESLSVHTLYNRNILEKRFPKVKIGELDRSIERAVDKEIMDYLKRSGFLRGEFSER